MTQLDGLADSLAATSLGSVDPAMISGNRKVLLKPAKASFASALRSGHIPAPIAPNKDDELATASPDTIPGAEVSSDIASPAQSLIGPPTSVLVPVDDTILQAIRKRDDRIFFSQYENQMAAFVQDNSRDSLEIGAMNTYQRLLIHRCADQFRLDHQLDRATHCITLSKTPTTSHPSALLSVRAREYIVQRGESDLVNMYPGLANLAGSSDSSPNTSSPASPAPASAPAAAPVLLTQSSAPKSGFKIMRRDPSSSRQSPLRSIDSADSDSDRAKSRKDMTLEEREASYKAARARIFGDVATSGASSPLSATSPPDTSKEVDPATSSLDINLAPSNTAASCPVASVSRTNSASRSKTATSSSSSVTSQDGSAHRNRGNVRSKAGSSNAAMSVNDDVHFSRVLPTSSSSAFGAPQQSSPLSLSGHVAGGYFPTMTSSQGQPAHPNLHLRSGAPIFQPSGHPHPSVAAQVPRNGHGPSPQWQFQAGQLGENDSFPALGGSRQDGQNGVVSKAQLQANPQFRQVTGNDAWDRHTGSPAAARAGQEQYMNGVNAWAQQTSTYTQNGPAFYPSQQQQQQQQQPYPGPSPYVASGPSFSPQSNYMGQQTFAPMFAGARSAASSRASSQRGGATRSNSRGGARDDAMSVSSISSTASSRSASFSGVSGAGSASASQPANSGSSNSKKVTLAHPSLPARPTWLSPPRPVGADGKETQ